MNCQYFQVSTKTIDLLTFHKTKLIVSWNWNNSDNHKTKFEYIINVAVTQEP